MDAERFETQVSIHTHFDAEARDKHPRTEGFHILVEDIWTTQARESDHQTSDWWMTEEIKLASVCVFITVKERVNRGFFNSSGQQ